MGTLVKVKHPNKRKTKLEREKEDELRKKQIKLQEDETKFSERLFRFRKHVIKTAETIFKYRQGRKKSKPLAITKRMDIMISEIVYSAVFKHFTRKEPRYIYKCIKEKQNVNIL